MAKKAAVVVPEVVEENRAVVPAKSSALEAYARGQFSKSSEKEMANEVTRLYEAVFDSAVKRALHFGSVFYAVEFELGSRGKLKRGRGNADEGMRGWLEKNCPYVSYPTAMRWKELAVVQANRLCGKGVSPSDAILMLQGRDDEIEKPAPKKAVALRDEIYSVPSIRKLTQGWFDFGDGCEAGKHRGRPKGTKADLSKKPDSTDTIAAARAVWSQVIVPAEKTFPALESAVKLLNAADVENAKIILQNLMDLLNEQEKALKPNVH